MFGRVFTARPLRHRPEARLPPRQHRARARRGPTSGPSSPTTCAQLVRDARTARDPARRGPGRDPRRGRRRSRRSSADARRRARARARRPTWSSPEAGAAVRRTPRWTATRCVPPTPPARRDDAPVRLRVVGELPAGHAPTDRGRRRRGDPHHDRRADARRRRRDRDGRAHRRATATTACSITHRRSTAGDHVRRAGGDLEAGDVVFEPGTVLGPAHLGVLASIDVAPGAGVPARAGRRAVDRRRAGRVGPARARARSATPTVRCCSRCSPARASSRRPRASRATTRPTMTATLERRARTLRRGDHERRRVGRRLRLRERRARAHRGRRSRPARHASTGTRWRSSPRSRCASRSCAARRCSGSPATRCRRS